MKDQEPLLADFRVSFARPPLPVHHFACFPMLPLCVDVDHGEGAVFLFGNNDPERLPRIMDQLIILE